MTGERGGCCCNHDDLHDNHDNHDHHDHHDKGVQAPQATMATVAPGCCGGAKVEESSRSDDHAGHFTAVPSSS